MAFLSYLLQKLKSDKLDKLLEVYKNQELVQSILILLELWLSD